MYDEHKATILGVQEVAKEDVNKYGIVSGNKIKDGLYEVKDLVEKPNIDEAPTNVAILGRYIIAPEIFHILETTKPGAGGEIQLTDALKELAKQQKMYAYTFEGKRYDVGNKLGFLQATVEFALEREDLKDGFKEYLVELIKSI